MGIIPQTVPVPRREPLHITLEIQIAQRRNSILTGSFKKFVEYQCNKQV